MKPAHLPHHQVSADRDWRPTIGLAWLHGALALGCGILGGTGLIQPWVGLACMGLFAGVAMLFALLTLTRS